MEGKRMEAVVENFDRDGKRELKSHLYFALPFYKATPLTGHEQTIFAAMLLLIVYNSYKFYTRQEFILYTGFAYRLTWFSIIS